MEPRDNIPTKEDALGNTEKKRPSAKRPRSRTCVVTGCSNSDYQLGKWRENFCEIHNTNFGSQDCSCRAPFKLFTFPSKNKGVEKLRRREHWKLLVNRKDIGTSKLWTPKKQSRVCSTHFVDGEPTAENPYPSLKLGYDSATKVKELTPVLSGRKRRKQLSYGASLLPATKIEKSGKSDEESFLDHSQEQQNTTSIDLLVEDMDLTTNNPDSVRSSSLNHYLPKVTNLFVIFRKDCYIEMMISLIYALSSLLSFLFLLIEKNKEASCYRKGLNHLIIIYKNKNELLAKEVRKLRARNSHLKLQLSSCSCSKPLYKTLLKNDADVTFFTGLNSFPLFEKLHDVIVPYVRQRWRGVNNTAKELKRKFSKVPKRMGPKRKLDTKDEFLMFLMRLRLGLMLKDLSKRFKVSQTLTSSIITSWLRCSAQVLKSFVFVPDQGTLNIIKPPHFQSVNKLHSIIDCTEIFIQTPKDHKMQKITWSNYKHHNTMKILVAVSANSTIIFVSKAYSGCISDKELVKQCCYLDLVEPFSSLMVDKGFNITEECIARNINLLIPPGKRGKAQMTPTELRKTKEIASKRIIVEQVLSQLKKFKIIANEVTLLTVPQLDDIIIVCSAIVNMMKPIY